MEKKTCKKHCGCSFKKTIHQQHEAATKPAPHIEGTQEEEGGLQAHGEDEAQDGDDHQCTDAERLGHDDDDDERRKDSHPQQRRQMRIQHYYNKGGKQTQKRKR